MSRMNIPTMLLSFSLFFYTKRKRGVQYITNTIIKYPTKPNQPQNRFLIVICDLITEPTNGTQADSG